ncbi:MAG: tetratricopeptide repeat protein [Selenomonas sp.]|uniref:tetratricopeptide repeat protein n=1 Tax=Selenomonas sp. AB3002 TaxID=1392502 RepID=UPI0004950EBD|nr:tetratricopeptide repeat protein [Selenomonas sp.]
MNSNARHLAAGLACLFILPSFTACAKEAAPSYHENNLPAQNLTLSRPVFPEKMPGKANQKAIKAVHFLLAPAYAEPLTETAAQASSITILGQAEATQEQMVAFIKKRNPSPKLTCSVEEIVSNYYKEAGREGIRPDVALCQALKETGFFAYGGDVLPSQNNYCGLGATGNKVKGAAFPTAAIGVRAHIQHLLAYTSTKRPQEKIVDPRYELLIQSRPDLYGKIKYWTGLNGNWAVPGTTYGEDILNLWQQAQAPDGSDTSMRAAEQKLKASKDASAYVYRGIVYSKRGETDKAMADFTSALRHAPKSTAARYNLALMETQQGREKDALKTYNQLIKDTPTLPQAWYNRGLLLLKANKHKEAAKDFEKVLELIPQQADACSNLALCRVAQGKYEEAWKLLHRAAEINNTNMTVLGNQYVFEACLE